MKPSQKPKGQVPSASELVSMRRFRESSMIRKQGNPLLFSHTLAYVIFLSNRHSLQVDSVRVELNCRTPSLCSRIAWWYGGKTQNVISTKNHPY